MHPRRLLALPIFASFLLLTASGLSAQGTPEATPGGPSEGYPVAVHEGTCDNPTSEPAWEVGNAVAVGTDQDEPDVIGTEVTRNVATTTTALDVSLDDLASSEHVIAVHAGQDQMGTLVACGQVAGIRDQGKLVVALVQVGDSDVSGIAIFDQDESGALELEDGQTQVTVHLIVPSDEDAATPDA